MLESDAGASARFYISAVVVAFQCLTENMNREICNKRDERIFDLQLLRRHFAPSAPHLVTLRCPPLVSLNRLKAHGTHFDGRSLAVRY